MINGYEVGQTIDGLRVVEVRPYTGQYQQQYAAVVTLALGGRRGTKEKAVGWQK